MANGSLACLSNFLHKKVVDSCRSVVRLELGFFKLLSSVSKQMVIYYSFNVTDRFNIPDISLSCNCHLRVLDAICPFFEIRLIF